MANLWNIEKDIGYVMSFVITDVLRGALMSSALMKIQSCD